MKTKILFLFLAICIIATVECKKKKCRGRSCSRNSSGSKESPEDDYEPCKEFCERREREKQNEKDRQRSCMGRGGRGRKGCRGGIKERKGSKERKGNSGSSDSMRERDCECESRKVSYFTKKYCYAQKFPNWIKNQNAY